MKYIRNDSTNPYENLAFEEYVFTHFFDDDYVLLWQNDNAVIVGRYQNTLAEINRDFAKEQEVRIVRRNTGGGAVYHDLGNLNFSFITGWDGSSDIGMEPFLDPVIETLRKIGVPAEKSGRNDILADGKKISGNAQTVAQNRILHHGTLLLHSDLEMVQNVLQVSKDKLSSKGIKSVKSRVANIREYLAEDLPMEAFQKELLATIFRTHQVEEIQLSQNQKIEIHDLAKRKYETWEWNYGSSPDANYRHEERFPGGKIAVEMDIHAGIIQRCRIKGDFLSLLGIGEIENALLGVRHDSTEMYSALRKFELWKYISGFSIDQLVRCFA